MMVSFYRPTPSRPAILIEAGAFPSDRHAVESQIRFHGFDPDTDLIELLSDEADGTISMQAIERAIAEHGPRLALVLWPGIQYRTGQAFDLKEIARLAHVQGAVAGFDLAHAAGNLPLQLHDSGADFAVWCHYKYMNAGPGAVAGCFVHERHAHTDRPRFAGWWGHERKTRFQMGPEFVPTPGADGWQLSNPPILGLAPLLASLELFDKAGGLTALRTKSEKLTGFLEALIRARVPETLQIVTPAEPERRGCQLSLRVAGGRERGRELFEYLSSIGTIGDWREPDVIRISPAPLYNKFMDVYRFVEEVESWRGV
jgi:kynureninase